MGKIYRIFGNSIEKRGGYAPFRLKRVQNTRIYNSDERKGA